MDHGRAEVVELHVREQHRLLAGADDVELEDLPALVEVRQRLLGVERDRHGPDQDRRSTEHEGVLEGVVARDVALAYGAHAVMLERPERFNEVVTHFLDERDDED